MPDTELGGAKDEAEVMPENLALADAEGNHKQVQVPFCSVCDI